MQDKNKLDSHFVYFNYPSRGDCRYRLLSVFSHVSLWTWVLFFMWAMTGISITAGYHRLFSHQAYQASWIVKLFFICFGAATFEGSVTEWCCDHRYHHRYTDMKNPLQH